MGLSIPSFRMSRASVVPISSPIYTSRRNISNISPLSRPVTRELTESKGKIFRHFKGDLYLVEDFVKHSETQETMVLYRALYGECGLFVRPYEMFVEEVPEGKINPTGQKYRFQEYEVKSVK